MDHDALKCMINKPQLSGRIARWVLLLQEFNFTVQVRPGKQHANADHLSRLSMVEAIEPIDDNLPDAHIFNVDIIHLEYVGIIHYLTQEEFPVDFIEKQKKRLIFKAEPYTMLGETLYKKSKNGVLRRCINPIEVPLILKGCHDDSCGGHFANFVTDQKVLQCGYWWPTLFWDAHEYTQRCDPCQE